MRCEWVMGEDVQRSRCPKKAQYVLLACRNNRLYHDPCSPAQLLKLMMMIWQKIGPIRNDISEASLLFFGNFHRPPNRSTKQQTNMKVHKKVTLWITSCFVMHILSLNHRRAAWHEKYCFETNRRTIHIHIPRCILPLTIISLLDDVTFLMNLRIRLLVCCWSVGLFGLFILF